MPKFSMDLSPEDEAEGWKATDWYTNGPGGEEAWRVQFDRKIDLPDEAKPLLDTETWDKEFGTYDLAKTVMFLGRYCPDAEVVRWRHMPLPIYVQGLSIAPKIFEIENAMSLREAIDVAKATWKEQFGKLGIPATIVKARLATKKDFKKFKELRELEPEEVSDEGSDVQGSEPTDEAGGSAGSGERQVSELWVPKQS